MCERIILVYFMFPIMLNEIVQSIIAAFYASLSLSLSYFALPLRVNYFYSTFYENFSLFDFAAVAEMMLMVINFTLERKTPLSCFHEKILGILSFSIEN